MTSGSERIDPAVGPGGGRRRRGQPPSPATGGQTLVLVGIASLVAVALASAALFVALTRPTASNDTSCRAIAWRALPTADTLPDGWTLTGSGFYSDGYGASLVGPAPASGQAGSPGINVRVSCLGADGHLAVTRSHDSDLALGGTDLPFADIGDEAVATQDAAGTTTSVYIRRGQLVASLAASQAIDPADLEQTAQAIDDAMMEAESSAGAGSSPTTEPPGSDALGPEPSDEIPTDEPGASVPESHAFPDLEAVLPTKVGGVTLVTDSTTGSDALGGDPASQDLLQSLSAYGKTGDDLEYAESYDPSDTLAGGVIALRLKGLAAAKLRQAIVESWTAAIGSGGSTSQATVGGKKVTVIDYGDGGTKDYLFEQGEAVIIVTAADLAAATVLLTALK
jgi:hypothetical protein